VENRINVRAENNDLRWRISRTGVYSFCTNVILYGRIHWKGRLPGTGYVVLSTQGNTGPQQNAASGIGCHIMKEDIDHELG
jgi:hypothetical protein